VAGPSWAKIPPWTIQRPTVDIQLTAEVSKQEQPSALASLARGRIATYGECVQIYTDASKTSDGRVGVGCYMVASAHCGEMSQSVRVTDNVSVYAGEMAAIRVAYEYVRQLTDRTANRILGMIKTSFCYLSKDVVLKLYKSLARPHLEYCVQAWRPYLKKDIELIEGVQRRATKLIKSLKDETYENRVKKLHLTSMETRRLRGDLIEAFKMFKGMDNLEVHKLEYTTTSHVHYLIST
jgi:hypothetical protein